MRTVETVDAGAFSPRTFAGDRAWTGGDDVVGVSGGTGEQDQAVAAAAADAL